VGASFVAMNSAVIMMMKRMRTMVDMMCSDMGVLLDGVFCRSLWYHLRGCGVPRR
jgi:hypothetical protein